MDANMVLFRTAVRETYLKFEPSLLRTSATFTLEGFLSYFYKKHKVGRELHDKTLVKLEGAALYIVSYGIKAGTKDTLKEMTMPMDAGDLARMPKGFVLPRRVRTYRLPHDSDGQSVTRAAQWFPTLVGTVVQWGAVQGDLGSRRRGYNFPLDEAAWIIGALKRWNTAHPGEVGRLKDIYPDYIEFLRTA